ncbi:hypothetical protein Dxin01_00097 [Deinococcus xinjiangensis]|uniref:Uncharacterized protein n=1 Tax=Deinococcus xinjiangensis TaxID=457454 RepID=A0ABP9V6X1_9DEIO
MKLHLNPLAASQTLPPQLQKVYDVLANLKADFTTEDAETFVATELNIKRETAACRLILLMFNGLLSPVPDQPVAAKVYLRRMRAYTGREKELQKVLELIAQGHRSLDSLVAHLSLELKISSAKALSNVAVLINNGILEISSSVSVDTPSPLTSEASKFIVWTQPVDNGSRQSPTIVFLEEAQALKAATNMCEQHGRTFYVMKGVKAVRPIARTQVVDLT